MPLTGAMVLLWVIVLSSLLRYGSTTSSVEEPAAPPASLGAFWDGVAHFELVSSTVGFPTSPNNPGSALANEGTFIVPHKNGTWYLFYREVDYTSPLPDCQNVIPPFRVVVRTSIDAGRTWSTYKHVVAQPVPNSPDECAIVDGAAYYDEDTVTWHYLGQCIARTGGWSMCHYSLRSESPLAGRFVSDSHNPVVRGGQLWRQICGGRNKHCTSGTVDEGTPEIVMKRNGYYYITFHGYDYSKLKSFRGVARTANWYQWQVSGPDLPNDAIFSSIDCEKWKYVSWANGQCVGGGEATILVDEDGYLYQLIEAPDISLSCLTTLGQQNWVLGLMRARNFTFITGQWQVFTVDPMIIPWKKYGCGLQYARLFKDPFDRRIYLEYWINDFATNKNYMDIYRLVDGPPNPPLPMVATPGDA